MSNSKLVTQALEAYSPTDAEIAEMALNCSALTVDGLDDKEGLALVHKARMTVKKARVQVEHTRKELKKDALAFGQAIDREAKRITGLLVAIEDPLREKESIVEAEKQRLAELEESSKREALQARLDAFADVDIVVNPLEVQQWTDEQFEERLAHAAAVHGENLAAAAKAEAERKASEAAAEAKLAEERETLRIEREAAQAKQRAADEKAAAERKRIDAERIQLETERQKIRDEKAKALREQEVEAAKREAVELAKRREAEAEAAREAAEAEAERLRPQIEKIQVFADRLRALPIPDVDCAEELAAIIGRACEAIRQHAKSPQTKEKTSV